jgi:hypothetical protein
VARYRFVTSMRFRAPIRDVYATIVRPEGWVAGWGDAVAVRRTADGSADGRGAAFEATVRAPIGYRLAARIETVAADAPTSVSMRATGDLEGTGTWELRQDAGCTDVRFTWDVRTTETWINVLTPVARPLFEWSHGVVMRNATEAAAAHLDAELSRFDSRPAGRPRHGRRLALLGVVAGAVVVAVRRSTDGRRVPSMGDDPDTRREGEPWPASHA